MSHSKENGHKERVEYSAVLVRDRALEEVENMLASLQQGELHVQHGSESIDLSIGDHVQFDFTARRKGRQESVQITLQWERQDAQRRLVIASSAPADRNSAMEAERGRASRRVSKSPPYEEWTREELYERARELEIEGRSDMNKDDLIAALRV